MWAVVVFRVYRGYVREQVAAGARRVGGIVVLNILYKTGGSLAYSVLIR